jgi:hypothetical protein
MCSRLHTIDQAARSGGFSGRTWRRPLRALLAAATISTTLVGLWLVWVLVAALSWAFLIAGPRRRGLLWSVVAASVAAVGAGAYGVVSMLRVASAGGDFEGCILLMGSLIGGHGLVALAHAALTAGGGRRARGGGGRRGTARRNRRRPSPER